MNDVQKKVTVNLISDLYDHWSKFILDMEDFINAAKYVNAKKIFVIINDIDQIPSMNISCQQLLIFTEEPTLILNPGLIYYPKIDEISLIHCDFQGKLSEIMDFLFDENALSNRYS